MDSVKSESLLSLPPEILLRILHFASVPSITTLYRVSRGLKSFIDTQEQAIFSAVTTHNADEVKSFSRYYEGVNGWKELCKRQTQLRENWESETPLTTESVIHVGDPAWRFRPDFKRLAIFIRIPLNGHHVGRASLMTDSGHRAKPLRLQIPTHTGNLRSQVDSSHSHWNNI